jgi:hypothetical protein
MRDLQVNVVPAKGQTFVPFIPPEKEGSGLRVLFLGNSFTYHRPRPEIGWERSCGMAASDLEHDYVHRLMARIREKDPQATHAIHSTSFLIERNLEDFCVERFNESRAWNPDVVICFFGENVPKDQPELAPVFGEACRALRRHISADGHAKCLWVGCFYDRPDLSEQKRLAAEAFGDPYISLDDLTGREDVHGDFNHPNDFGMDLIAQRMFDALQEIL